MRTKDLLLVVWVCWAAVLWWSGQAAAGASSAVMNPGASKTSTGYTFKGPGATAANGAFNAPVSVNAAGKAVQMPAKMRFAANAAHFAVGAMRLNPATLVAGALAAWALEEGLQWANNSWTKTAPAAGKWVNTGNRYYAWWDSMSEAATSICSAQGGYTGSSWLNPTQPASSEYWRAQCGNGAVIDVQHVCASAGNRMLVASDPGCIDQGAQVPATENDFLELEARPLPDAAAEQLANGGYPVPVEKPVLDPVPKVENYGEPFIDPATGKKVQTKTRLTPSPTELDPLRVQQDSYNVEVAPAPEPVPGEPAPVPKDEQPKDPCLDNPDRVGCMDGGQSEDTSLETKAVPFVVTPVSFGGAGNCPPDPVINVHGMTAMLKLGPICDGAGWLRPLVLALAWLSAAMIISGAVKES